MFQIRNSGNITEIDVFGDIGVDWWTGEGNTLETVSNQIKGIKSEIKVNISSLGGDLFDGFAIYDLFKSHPYQITGNLVGATASAASIIAMGCDKVICSENALHLGHKASTGAWGNAQELRKAAETLDTCDARIVAIYKKKTGKSDDEIHNWLDQDKWITPEDAMNFGIVDEIYTPEKVINSADYKKLSAIKPLPTNFKNPEMENNESTLKNSIQNLLGFKNDASLKAENEALKTELEALKSKVVDTVDTTSFTKEIEGLKSEVTNKVTELDAVKAELDALKITNDAKDAELAKYKAGGVDLGAQDPNPDGNAKDDESTKVLKNILASFTPQQKALYGNG